MIMQIGLDTFSYHRYFGEHTPWEAPLDVRWTTADFLSRAMQLGVDAVSLQSCYLPELTPQSCALLREQIDACGLGRVLEWGHSAGLEGGANPGKQVELLRLLPAARALGCALMRIVCGNQFYWVQPVRARRERLEPYLRELAAEARGQGLTLAVENHADFNLVDLVAMVEAVGADNLGICFDTGNAVRVGDDLHDALELALPHIRMLHLKDLVVQAASRGDPTAWWPSAPLGRGDFDLERVVERLAAAGFDGTLFIELANLYTTWTDEDAVVAESLAWLRQRVSIR